MVSTNPQKGSALVYILIAVALFAALSYTVAQMMKSGSPISAAQERPQLFAAEILDFGRAVRQGVQSVKISNGCADTAISFENPFLTGYDHTPPVSSTCKIFDASGGNVQYVAPAADWLDSSFNADPAYKTYVLTGENAVDAVGSATADLILTLPFLKKSVCEAINEKLGNTAEGDAVPDDGMDGATKFQGTYAATQTPGAGGGAAALSGKMAGCLLDTSGTTTYTYYQVLIPR